MRDGVIIQHRLSLAEGMHRMIPAEPCLPDLSQ